MTCSACVNSIERAVNELPGVSASVNFASETVHVLAPSSVDVKTIINNLKIINNRLRLKPFEDIYLNDNITNRNKWESAKKIEFFLGLKECKSTYRIENIIRNIKTPEELFHY